MAWPNAVCMPARLKNHKHKNQNQANSANDEQVLCKYFQPAIMLKGVFMKKKEKHKPKLVAFANELEKYMKTEYDISNLNQL